MAATGDFWGVFEGSITGSHMEVDRRPYHKNCSCALHQSRGGATKLCPHHKANKISFPIRRCFSEGSLALYAAAQASNASSSVSPSPTSSPAIDTDRIASISHYHRHHHHHHHHLEICNEEEGDDLFPSKI